MKKRFTLILASMFLTLGAWAQITAVSDLNNTSAYTIQSLERGFFFYDDNGDVTSSSATTLTNVAPTGTDSNEKFAFLRGTNTPEGQYYLYCVAGAKFVTHNSGVDIVLTDEPLHCWTVAAATSGNYSGFTLTKSTGDQKLNITNAANGASNGCKVAATGVDGGNLMTIRVYGTAESENFEAALAKIAELESYGYEANYTTDASFWSESPVYPKGLKSNTTANSQNSSAHVGATGHTIYKAATAVVTNGTEVSVGFQYDLSGAPSCGLYIAGVDIVNVNGEVVASDYHLGFTGGSNSNATYSLGSVATGNYIIRYYVCRDGDNRLDATAGTITVTGAKEITEAADVTTMLTSLESNTNTYVVPFKGNGLGYYDETAVSAIVTQMDETVGETVAANTAAFVALDDAVDALTLVPDGTFIRIKNNDATGYLVSGTGTGTAQFETEATAASAANSIFYYTDGKLLSFSNGMYIANGAKLTYTNTVGEAAGTAINFEVSQEAGKVQISFMNGSNVRYFHSSGTGDSDAGDNNAKYTTTVGYRFTIEEVATFPVTIGTVGYATLHAPVALTIPDGVKAYTGTLNGEWLTLNEVSTTIPANTAVILEATETLTEATTFNFTVATATEFTGDNDLVGTVAAELRNDRTVYTLQSHEGGVAFKKYTGDNLYGFKAYLAIEAAQAQAIRITRGGDEETTSIDNSEALGSSKNGQLTIYDLAGRRVEKMEKGIYIVNGKKVVK